MPAQVVPIAQLLQSKALPDLERGLNAVHYKKMQPVAFVGMLRGLRAACDAMPSAAGTQGEEAPCKLLHELFPAQATDTLGAWLHEVSEAIDERAALSDDKTMVLRGDARPDAVRDCQKAIADAEMALESYRAETIQPLSGESLLYPQRRLKYLPPHRKTLLTCFHRPTITEEPKSTKAMIGAG